MSGRDSKKIVTSDESLSTVSYNNNDNPNKPFQTYHQVKRESAHR
jgi:hypothetical protein